LADKADLSLGRTNHALKALVQKRSVELKNFTRRDSKLEHLYLLTPKGVDEATLTRSFVPRKYVEPDDPQADITYKIDL